MAIKMRVLHYTNKAKLKAAAELIKADYELAINAVDIIPPAYSCNNERIVVLVLSVKNDADDTLRRFLIELTKARAQNVAIICDGNEEAVANIKKYLAAGQTNVIDPTLFMKVGLFGGKNLSDEETAQIRTWMKNVIDSLA